MNIAEINEVIEAYFAENWTHTPIAWENVPFEANTSEWVRFTNLPDTTNTEELGQYGVGIREGVVVVQIFTKAGQGSRRGAILSSKAEDLFHLLDIGSVKFKSAYTTNDGIDPTGNWMQHTVTCPYWTWINE